MYTLFLKRSIDLLLALTALILLWPLFLLLAAVGAVAMGGNPFFTQLRPGRKGRDGRERVFRLIKFRTMSNKTDSRGKLLPDEARLNRYGKFLRASSLDELPELINVIKGDMSLVGPRPQLVRDMVFMSRAQRRRHQVRPGLTGLAQVNGRNCIPWEQKLEYDLQYIERITFAGDMKILLKTVKKVLFRRDVVREGTASDMDFGDWLLMQGKITRQAYARKQDMARRLLED